MLYISHRESTMNAKLTRKNRNTIIVILLMCPILIGDFLFLFKTPKTLFVSLIPFFITFIIFTLLMFILNQNNNQKIKADERILRIEGRAFSYSWYVMFYSLMLFILNNQLDLIYLTIDQILLILLAILFISFFTIKGILNKNGDLES